MFGLTQNAIVNKAELKFIGGISMYCFLLISNDSTVVFLIILVELVKSGVDKSDLRVAESNIVFEVHEYFYKNNKNLEYLKLILQSANYNMRLDKNNLICLQN